MRAAWGYGDDGRRRRFVLARRVAEDVLPGFEAARPADGRPRAMLALAEAVRRGEVDREAAMIGAVALRDEVIEMLDEKLDEPAMNAGLAAVRVVGAAGWDEGPVLLDDPRDDDEVDADMWGTDFLASMVDAPSLPKMRVAEHVEPRRAFWRWYLGEAVPAADRA